MKYRVNETCIGCGMCAATCPAVFFMNDDGVAEAIDESTFDASAEDAKAGCPVGAIEGVEE